MKKNLLSILILALLIVNLVFSTVIMISVTSTNKKTAAVIGDIAKILNLELESGKAGEEIAEVSIDDTAVYDIADQMTIPLKKGEDGKDHFALVSVTLAMDMKHDDYETYGGEESMKAKESLIKGLIVEAFGDYTMEQIQADNGDAVREDILKRIQTMFDSDFIYKVTFRDIIEQ
nr:flagellar basal body-associated FliL family protein [Lachnospiraceae bacterium]